MSNLLLFMFHKMPIGFSPCASHCNTAGSPRRAVWFLSLISNCGGAEKTLQKDVQIENRNYGEMQDN